MEDYPKTLTEFERRFATDADCLRYLRQLRWPEGFHCPGCQSKGFWETKRGLLICRQCERQTSPTSGTIFHRHHISLRLWFRALWWMTNQKLGVSALGLQRLLGLGSYRTAWTWLHKLRRGMVRPGRDRLSGRIEVDETYVGGATPGKRGRGSAGKALVAIAAQEDGSRIGRIRMKRIPDASAPSLLAFIRESIMPRASIITDDWSGYDPVGKQGYRHTVRTISGSGKTASARLPRVHRVASLFKRWLLGTHQGAISPKHLDFYLDEFTFRFNRRTSLHRGKLFNRLVQQAAAQPPTPYSRLISS